MRPTFKPYDAPTDSGRSRRPATDACSFLVDECTMEAMMDEETTETSATIQGAKARNTSGEKSTIIPPLKTSQLFPPRDSRRAQSPQPPRTPSPGYYSPGSLSSGTSSPRNMSITSLYDDGESAFDSKSRSRSRSRGCPRSGAAVDGDKAPKFIMPSLTIPSRRPFTEAGKAMGKLKILVAGSSGRWSLCCWGPSGC